MTTNHSKKYTDFLKESLKYIPNYDGLNILEVGVGNIDNFFSKVLYDYFKPKSIIGIDPRFTHLQIADNFKVLSDDIRNTTFEDNQFDCIVSIAVFEHVHNLDLALEEMYRILRPGGKVFSIFGPIYSSPVGHHLWFSINDKVYSYPNLNIPAYAHLLLTEQEFAECLSSAKIADKEDAKILSNYVYHSEEQNRYLFNDYEKFFNDSKFKVNYLKGTPSFPNLQHLLHEDISLIHEKLNKKFPNLPLAHFDANSIIVCLEK